MSSSERGALSVPLLPLVDEHGHNMTTTSPEDAAGLLSRASFGWIYALLVRGVAARGVSIDDLPPARGCDDPCAIATSFDAAWRAARGARSIPRVLHALLWGRFWAASALLLVGTLANASMP